MNRTTLVLGTTLATVAALCCSHTPKDAPKKGTAAPEATPALATNTSSENKFNPRLLRRFSPLRERFDSVPDDANPERILLGRTLYYETRLSRAHDISCNSCHHLDQYGVDGEPTSPGHKGQRGARNSPTVYHAAGAFQQFWDGRSPNVEEQAKGPIMNPVEMAMASADQVIHTVKSMPEYRQLFAKAFPGEANPINYDNLGKAIGAFERGLVTPSRWDKFLKGDESALTAGEVEGLRVFTNVGCMVCHTGELVGGTSYQKVGVVEAWPNQSDQGRFVLTKLEGDRMSFKVPTLRNVDKTGPYFHDASARSLDVAVRMMGRHQLGLELSAAEVDAIVAWLKTLTGELPREYIAQPKMPPAGPDTPQPDRT